MERRGNGTGVVWEVAVHGMCLIAFTVIGKIAERLLDVAGYYCDKIRGWWNPRVEVVVPERGNQYWYDDNPLFIAIDNYLCRSASSRVRRLHAQADGDDNVTYAMDKGEHLTDAFPGGVGSFHVRWDLYTERTPSSHGRQVERRFYKLSFDPRRRSEVIGQYLRHVVETSREIEGRRSMKKLYSNSMGSSDGLWTSVFFKHPGTFATLAMDPKKKQAIIDDLTAFSKSKDYYASIGKAWKRGYLLYGPPGTGKSSMVAAIANHLDYDVYDLELTAVSGNGELRRLMITTKSRSVIVIEDIDCSLDLTGDRNGEKKKDTRTQQRKDDDGSEEQSEKDDQAKSGNSDKKSGNSAEKVTLSGLLNSIDGLWSVCGGERIIVFTTNHPEKLDPALLRRGRMDMHIELSYCDFESFKLLAKNYLDLDGNPLFPEIQGLLAETQITPADVAEHLMPKNAAVLASAGEEQQEQILVNKIPPEVKTECLKDLIRALVEAKDVSKTNGSKTEETDGPPCTWSKKVLVKNPIKEGSIEAMRFDR